jgi:hypothetical protein
MDRAIPSPGNEEIDLYTRTYYSLLRSSGEIQIRSLEETHAGMGSSLHLHAEDATIDLGAFIYAYLRLPPVMERTRLVVLGQSSEVFMRRGYPNIREWTPVQAPGRRRRAFFDGKDILAAQIASVSDIDDLVPMLVALQIEWNKIHAHLSKTPAEELLRKSVADGTGLSPADADAIRQTLELSESDFARLHALWGEAWPRHLLTIVETRKSMSILLIAGSFVDYRKATEDWWREIERATEDIRLSERPVYFVSSNTHSLANLLSGFALTQQAEIAQYLRAVNPEGLWEEYLRITEEGLPGLENLLYYTYRPYAAHAGKARQNEAALVWERECGIIRIAAPPALDVGAQVIEVCKLNPERLDRRIQIPGMERLKDSPALILNIDYPLGMSAYLLLNQAAANLGELRGVYLMGKAATLNGRVGDVMIPNVVYDEHSQNTFLFKNCFSAADVASHLNQGTVFDNQKAVTVRGTFLQNRDFMHVFYREGYTDIEMEAGPYLSAVYENIYPKRYPSNEIVNLFINAWFDIGVLHYASDTPYSRRQELLSKSLSYFGVDSTYATSVAILRRILSKEAALT